MTIWLTIQRTPIPEKCPVAEAVISYGLLTYRVKTGRARLAHWMQGGGISQRCTERA